MARLPLVEADVSDMREWLTPVDIREAFRIQPQFVWPDCASVRWTLLSTVVPGAVFLGRLLPRAQAGQAGHTSWFSSTCVLWALGAVLGFAVAACSNPGVVPRAPARPGAFASAAPKYVTVNGVLIRQRWCSTCHVHRPLRSKHCSQCDRCVFRFDHHCTWLGNCVGLGNYRAFLLLVVAASLFYGHSMALTFQVLRRGLRGGGAAHALAWQGGLAGVLRCLFISNAGASLYFLYSLVMFFAFLVLLLYHTIIIACNLTTNEHVRDYYLTRNPFDVACADNYRQVLCAPYGRPVKLEFDHSRQTSEAVAQTVVPNFQMAAGESGTHHVNGLASAPKVELKSEP